MADLIDRQAAIDGLNALDDGYLYTHADYVDAVRNVPSADARQMQDRCKIDASSGLISRDAAIDALLERDPNCGIDSAKVIKQLPSAEPEIIRCEECMHNGSYDTDCPINWGGKEYCSFAERRTDEAD